MKNKILVIVDVPIIEEEYDMYIPINKKIGTIRNLIIQIIKEKTDGMIKDDGKKFLYDKLSGEILNDDLFVKNSTIKNGSKLILY